MCLNKLLILAVASLGNGESDWYTRKLEGWYYFQEQDQPEMETSYSPEEAQALLEEEKQSLQESLSLALLVPTQENVKAYVIKSERQLNRSAQFADAWGKILSETEQPAEDSNHSLAQQMSKTRFLLFCFLGQDPVSKQAAETALTFAEKNGWALQALSLDGRGVEGLETFKIDRGISKALDIKSTPSFYAIDPATNTIWNLGTGPLSTSELEQNIALQFGASNDK